MRSLPPNIHYADAGLISLRKSLIPSRTLQGFAAILVAGQMLALAADRPQWGERNSRNMASSETGLPSSFNPATRENILWTAPLGTKTYATPVIAEGRVYIGTNNGVPRDSRQEGDRGVLLCLNEQDGALVWQLVVPKVPNDRYQDWPMVGICSPPTVEEGRVYLMTNRGEILCLDAKGLSNGNDGPFMDERQFLAPDGQLPVEPGPMDADILWRCDLLAEAGCHRHDSAHASILIRGRHLYLNTCNGVDNTHKVLRFPDAPALVVMDKETGRILAREREGIGRQTVHGTWSSPSIGSVGGRELVFFGGPDGIVYAFEPVAPDAQPGDVPATLKCVWRFDCDPAAPKESNPHIYMGNRQQGPSLISGTAVFSNGKVFISSGGDIWWGRHVARLQCIDAVGGGDITHSGLVWTAPLERHCCTTPAIQDGFVSINDSGGIVHCLDALTGAPVWTHDAEGEMWASPLVADGKIYVGTRHSDFWVLAAGREKKVLSRVKLDSDVSGLAAANGVLYVATHRFLYAVGRRG